MKISHLVLNFETLLGLWLPRSTPWSCSACILSSCVSGCLGPICRVTSGCGILRSTVIAIRWLEESRGSWALTNMPQAPGGEATGGRPATAPCSSPRATSAQPGICWMCLQEALTVPRPLGSTPSLQRGAPSCAPAWESCPPSERPAWVHSPVWGAPPPKCRRSPRRCSQPRKH